MSHPAVRCVEFVELVTDWMEDGLDDDVRLAFEEHLIICPDCPSYVRQLRLALSQLRLDDNAAVTPPTAPPAAARSALLRELRARRGGAR